MTALCRRWPQVARIKVLACALGAALALAGCAGGDFGRTRSMFITDDMHGWIGAEATASIGEPASRYAMTDSERLLRDLAYPFIEPPKERPFWAGVFGDYVPISAPWRQHPRFDRTAYGRRLMDEWHRTPASRYAQLIDDIRNDITRLDPFTQAATRVLDLDAKRGASLAHVSVLSADEHDNARARMRENALIVKWVQRCLQQRISSYRWALERLVIAAPDPAAAEAERVLTQLSARASDPQISIAPVADLPLAVRG